MREHWTVKDGVLVFDGKGAASCTAKDYGDFEMYVDWKIEKDGDSGIYLRGTPQVQIWDPTCKPADGVGSGGLYNNQKNPSKPTQDRRQAGRRVEHVLDQDGRRQGHGEAQRRDWSSTTSCWKTTGNATSRSSPPARSSCRTTATRCTSRTSTSRSCRRRSDAPAAVDYQTRACSRSGPSPVALRRECNSCAREFVYPADLTRFPPNLLRR